MMMGVAFLLELGGVDIGRQTVADQDAAEVFSQNLVEHNKPATVRHDIEGEQLGGENHSHQRGPATTNWSQRYAAPGLGAVLSPGRRIGALLWPPADPSPERATGA